MSSINDVCYIVELVEKAETNDIDIENSSNEKIKNTILVSTSTNSIELSNNNSNNIIDQEIDSSVKYELNTTNDNAGTNSSNNLLNNNQINEINHIVSDEIKIPKLKSPSAAVALSSSSSSPPASSVQQQVSLSELIRIYVKENTTDDHKKKISDIIHNNTNYRLPLSGSTSQTIKDIWNDWGENESSNKLKQKQVSEYTGCRVVRHPYSYIEYVDIETGANVDADTYKTRLLEFNATSKQDQDSSYDDLEEITFNINMNYFSIIKDNIHNDTDSINSNLNNMINSSPLILSYNRYSNINNDDTNLNIPLSQPLSNKIDNDSNDSLCYKNNGNNGDYDNDNHQNISIIKDDSGQEENKINLKRKFENE